MLKQIINQDENSESGTNKPAGEAASALYAKPRTASSVVFGKVEGNITVTDRCELKQNAILHGDVVAGKLAIEEGATFMGSSTVGTPKSSAAKVVAPAGGNPPHDGGNHQG